MNVLIFLKALPIFIFLSGFSMAQTHQKRFLALGDSYTIGESVSEEDRWPVQLVRKLNANGFAFEEPRIIATTGWRTDDLRRAVEAANPAKNYDLVSLLIGVNNQYQGKSVNVYKQEFEELLKMAIALAGGGADKVFVVSIPDYGFTPFGKEKQLTISKELDEFNAINKSITAKYGIQYFNITDVSRRGLAEPDLVASDGLHPSGKMYSEWVDLIIKKLKIEN
jgi:lysophospholipase L1-like esterase